MNAETLTKIANDLRMAVMTSEPSRYLLGTFADRIEAIGSESPYAGIAVKALRRGDWNTAVGMVQVAARG